MKFGAVAFSAALWVSPFGDFAASSTVARAGDIHVAELKWSAERTSFPLYRATVTGEFEGDLNARMAMRGEPTAYKPHLAFYRVAMALGSPLVLRTEVYSIPLAEILHALAHDPAGLTFFRGGARVTNDGMVRLLLSEPVPSGHEVDILSGPEVQSWRGWAEGRDVLPPDRQRIVLAYVETLILDFLTANGSRRKVSVDSSKTRIFLTDNSGAFNERADPRSLEGILAGLKRVSRFPRRLIDRLRTFDRIEADATLRAGDFTDWLVATRPLSEMMERRRAIVSLVDARVAELGDFDLTVVP
jgi:hypothetical protein